jgi:transcriptional regulator with XRE-family HTH domain
MEYETWVRKLRALRVKRGLKQAEVAKRIRLSRPQYTAIENGNCIVNYEHLRSLAKAFGMTMSDLVSMTGVRLRTKDLRN